MFNMVAVLTGAEAKRKLEPLVACIKVVILSTTHQRVPAKPVPRASGKSSSGLDLGGEESHVLAMLMLRLFDAWQR